MKEHIDKTHPGVDHKSVIKSYTTDYGNELAEMCAKCFGYEYKRRKIVE